MKLNRFLKSALTLISGTIAAHLITLLTLPFIARLYGKEQFGELSVLISASAVLAILMSFKLETAIFNYQSRVKREGIVFSASLIASIVFTFCSFIVFFSKASLVTFFDNKISQETLLVMPLAALLIALFNLITNFSIAEKQYKQVAKAKVERAVAQSVIQLSSSFMSLGLILAEVVSRFFGMFSLARQNLYKKTTFKLNRENVITVLLENKRFIKYTTIAAFMNAASLQFPLLFIAANFDVAIAGIYFMTNRIVALPVSLLGQSLSQVYASEFSSNLTSKQKCLTLFHAVTRKGLLIALLLFSVLAFTAELLVTLVLGREWVKVADFILILTPMLIFQFAITPISNTLNMLNKQNYMAFWDALRFISLVVLGTFTVLLNWQFESFLYGFSSVLAICYCLLYVISLYELKNSTIIEKRNL